MVRLARAELFDTSEVAILHVIGRVTRRCFLFGFDPVSGKNFRRRKVWIEEQLKTQAANFGMWKHGETWGNMGTRRTRHFYVRSRFPEPRFEILSARTAREIGYVSLFRFKSFEISAGNHRCLHSYNETHFRIGRRERCLDSRSVELAMRFFDCELPKHFLPFRRRP